MGRWRKLGIIAGGGALPVRIAASCRACDNDYYVVRLAGFADAALSNLPGVDCALGETGKMLRVLKAENCDAVVFAGAVTRPDFKSLRVDWRGAALLPKAIAAATRGDGALLNVLVETIESEGLLVIGADEAMGDLAASAGAFGAHAPSAEDFNDIRKAAEVITALGSFDIGQGAVVANGLVLAVEAAEGTDAMLARCASLPASVKGGVQSGVLVKRPKPGQELRIDLPAIGPETVQRASEAGLRGIAVESGVALVIDRDEVVRLADQADIFVYGFMASEVSKM
jgi:UDP-2,3-diacylglucosamine hydrolase